MSNLSALYSEAIGLREVVDEVNKQEDAVRLQLKQNWLNSTVTQEIFSDISSKAAELEKQARDLACNYHQHQNHQQIVCLLTRAAELRKVISDYGSAA